MTTSRPAIRRSAIDDLFRRNELAVPRELAVGALLTALPSDWAVINSVAVPTNNTEIDHLVVGPAGVFTIGAKRHSGSSVLVSGRDVTIDGHIHSYIADAEAEALGVAVMLAGKKLLRSAVRPVVAIEDAKTISIRSQPELVEVITAAKLVRWLQKQPRLMSPSKVAELSALFLRS